MILCNALRCSILFPRLVLLYKSHHMDFSKCSVWVMWIWPRIVWKHYRRDLNSASSWNSGRAAFPCMSCLDCLTSRYCSLPCPVLCGMATSLPVFIGVRDIGRDRMASFTSREAEARLEKRHRMFKVVTPHKPLFGIPFCNSTTDINRCRPSISAWHPSCLFASLSIMISTDLGHPYPPCISNAYCILLLFHKAMLMRADGCLSSGRLDSTNTS